MAKDAKGHGSEKRGGSAEDRYFDMLKAVADDHFARSVTPVSAGAAARELAAGNPKAAVPVIHSGAAGRSDGPNIASISRSYTRNENANRHSENIALLAKHFGTPDEESKAREIIAERNRQGSLPSSTKSVPNVREFQHGITTKYSGKLR